MSSATVTVDVGALEALGPTWQLRANGAMSGPNAPLSVSPGATTITIEVKAMASTWMLRGTVDVPIVVLAGAKITLRLTDAFLPFFNRSNLLRFV